MDELTRRVVSYQQSGEGLPDLVRDLSAATYRFPLRNRRCTEDDCGEFLLFVEARIATLVHRYDFRGVGFESYLHSSLKWLLRTYLKRRDRRARQARLLQRYALWGDHACEVTDVGPMHESTANRTGIGCDDLPDPPTQPAALPFGPWFQRVHRGGQSRRRVMIIALKACIYLSESDIEMVASLTGTDLEWLRDCWLRLRVRLNCRRHRYDVLRLRRNRLFVLLQSLHERIACCSEPQERLRLSQEAELTRGRLDRLRRRISRLPRCPTNQEIAEVTAIPKGTIDSTLYYAKRRLFPNQTPARSRSRESAGRAQPFEARRV